MIIHALGRDFVPSSQWAPIPGCLRPVKIRRPKLTKFGDFLDSACHKTCSS